MYGFNCKCWGSLHQRQEVNAREGRLWQHFLKQALHDAVSAFASGITTKGFADFSGSASITSKSLMAGFCSFQSKYCRHQAIALLSKISAVVSKFDSKAIAVTKLLLCCQTWILQLKSDMYTSQHRVLLLQPLAHWHALNLDTCFLPCHAVTALSTCPTRVVLSINFLQWQNQTQKGVLLM